MPLQIFDETDLEAVKAQEAQLADLEETFLRAETAGMDVRDLKKRADEVAAKLRGFRQAFFPNQ